MNEQKMLAGRVRQWQAEGRWGGRGVRTERLSSLPYDACRGRVSADAGVDDNSQGETNWHVALRLWWKSGYHEKSHGKTSEDERCQPRILRNELRLWKRSCQR
jgi:hypothetical protein